MKKAVDFPAFAMTFGFFFFYCVKVKSENYDNSVLVYDTHISFASSTSTHPKKREEEVAL